MRIKIVPVLALIAACSGWNQAQPAAPAGHRPVADTHLTDAQIEFSIRAKLAKSQKIGPEGFTVHVKNKVATFEGKTNVIQHKGAATRMAHSAGAIGVENHIKISDEARRKAAEKLAIYRAGGQPVKHASIVH
jgi:osmotically-inducible protein OsmY